jgi:O-antigen ligase
MSAYPVIILFAAILLLAIVGAGIFPWTVLTVAMVLSLCLRPWMAGKAGNGLPDPRKLLASPLALLLGYLLLVLLPMPAGMSSLSGAARAQQNRIVSTTLEAVSDAGLDTGGVPWFSTTRSRAGTLRFLLLVIPMAASWRIMTNATARQREHWLRALLATAALMGVAGILGNRIHPQGDTLWWFIPVPHGLPGPMGGFMNRNHFAGFCAILAPAATALAVQDIRHRRILTALMNLASTAALSLGVLFSLSRGGMVALAAGNAVLLLIALLRGNTATRALTVLATVLLAASAIVVVQRHDDILERALSLRAPASELSLQTRIGAWRDSIRLWRQYPLLGAGPNAFRAVYPQHRRSSERDARDFAENEYVQWIAETGIAGALLFLFFAVRLVRNGYRALRAAPPGRLAAPVAAAAALAAAAAHALVDFPMHLPLYAITLAAITGLLWPIPGDDGTDGPPRYATEVPALTRWMGAAGFATALLLLCVDTRLDMAGRIGSANLADTSRALAGAPTSPVAWRRLAALLWQNGTPPAQALAERCLTQAAAYDPNNYPLWTRLGDMRRDLGDKPGAMDAYRRVKSLRDWVNVPTHLPEDP